MFADGKLFSIGMSGIVTAFDAATGKQLWQKPGLPAQPLWTSHSFSPLVDRDRVVVHMGGNNQGTLSAFDVNTGEVKWAWSGDGPGYGSPMLFEFGGTPQIVTMTQQKFIGLEAATGRLLWEQTYTTEYAQNIITPVRFGDTLIVSGFHKPMAAFRVARQKDQWRAEQVWENADVSLYMSDAVLDGETLVGFSERRSGQFFALDARSGKTLWTSEPRQGVNAAIVSAGEFWFALKDDGELVCRGGRRRVRAVTRYPVAPAHLGATGDCRQSRLREGSVDAVNVDIQLNERAVRAILITAVVSSAVAIAAQERASKPWRATATTDGQPDLQGVWTNATLTPFERSGAVRRAAVHDRRGSRRARVAGREKLRAAGGRPAPTPQRAPRAGAAVGSYNQAVWADPGPKVVATRQTSLVVDPPDGRVPVRPEAEQQRDAMTCTRHRLVSSS